MRLDMENNLEKQTKSRILGKISIVAGFISILLIALFGAGIKYNTDFLKLILVALGLSWLTGLITGISAFITHRAWIGLLINVVISAFLGVALVCFIVFLFYIGYITLKGFGLAP